MIRIQTLSDLAARLETSERELDVVQRSVSRLCDKITIKNLERTDKKPRVVYDPRRRLRLLQHKAYTNILAKGIQRFPNSHGGVKGKSTLTAAHRHKTQQFVYSGDIRNFYPSIHFSRVLGLFKELGFSDEVAQALTRLCTINHRLEQGFITSPILADRLFRPADVRIAKLCRKHGLAYTRYVDDITVSSPFDLGKSGIPKTIAKILVGTGFTLNEGKDQFANISDGAFILGLRVKKGRPLDVGASYVDETLRRFASMATLGGGGTFLGPYYSRQEMKGRLSYIVAVNKARRRELMSAWRNIDWGKVEAEAEIRGIAKRRPRVKIERG